METYPMWIKGIEPLLKSPDIHYSYNYEYRLPKGRAFFMLIVKPATLWLAKAHHHLSQYNLLVTLQYIVHLKIVIVNISLDNV